MSPEDLTGYELQRIRKEALGGKSFFQALEESDERAFYAFVWIKELRAGNKQPFQDVLARPFGEIIEAFNEQPEPDPTTAGSGQS